VDSNSTARNSEELPLFIIIINKQNEKNQILKIMVEFILTAYYDYTFVINAIMDFFFLAI
jgi:hypothetical protein